MNKMKKISINIPCYNEEENVEKMCSALVNLFSNELAEYDYEIIFADNKSTDRTREILREQCKKNNKIKAIFNLRNFGQANSPYYSLLQTTGDCTINMCCDFQDPVEMIPEFVKYWEEGYKTVIGIKHKSKENKLIHFCRAMYYKLFEKMSSIEQIEHFTGFGLYDKQFIDILRNIHEPLPFFKGIVAEYGINVKKVEYVQQKRLYGKSKNNFFTLYDYAMLSFTSYTKVGLRIATFCGAFGAFISFLVGVIYFILKLIYWNQFSAGIAPMMIVLLFAMSFQLIFIGLIGEYIININYRVMDRPLVIVEEKINFNIEKTNDNN